MNETEPTPSPAAPVGADRAHSSRIKFSAPVPSGILRCVVGALLGMAVIALPLAQYTTVLVLLRGSPVLLQPAPADDQPLPAQLVWSPWLYRLLTAVGGMPMAGALGVYIALVACAAYVMIRTINPTFRVTTGVDWDRTLLFRTYMHTAPLIKVIVVSVPTFVAAFAVWAVIGGLVGPVDWRGILAGGVFGAAAWIVLSRPGVIGDCDSGNYQMPRPVDMLGLGLRGAAVGISVWYVIIAAAEVSPERMIRLAVSVGGAGEGAWRMAAAGSLAVGALAGSVLALAVGLMKPNPEGVAGTELREVRSRHELVPPARMGILAAMVAAYVLTVGTWVPAHIRDRYDYQLRTGSEVRPAWWQPERAQDRLETLVAVGWGEPATAQDWAVCAVQPVGAAGLHLGAASMARLASDLKSKRGRTALFRSATMAQYDRACLDLDLTGRLRVLTDAVRATGDVEFARVRMDDLRLMAGLPEAKPVLAAFEQKSMFAYPTDDAKTPVGDLYSEYGVVETARRWYELSGMPPPRAAERTGRLVKVARSEVSGTLDLQSQDAEVRVGLIPAYGNLAPRIASLASGGRLGPFELREFIRVARPRSDGRFVVANVQSGAYRLAVWLRAHRSESNTAAADGDDASPAVSVTSDPASAAVIECDGYTDIRLGRVTVNRSSRR